jgi:hypothetical protein
VIVSSYEHCFLIRERSRQVLHVRVRLAGFLAVLVLLTSLQRAPVDAPTNGRARGDQGQSLVVAAGAPEQFAPAEFHPSSYRSRGVICR